MTRSLKVATVLASAMLAASVAAVALHPTLSSAARVPSFEAGLPSTFGNWRLQPSVLQQASVDVPSEGAKYGGLPYDQTVMRDYGDGHGNTVMLAVAYTDVQAQEVKTHRPEVCYPAQGYSIRQRLPADLSGIPRQGGTAEPLRGIRMLAGEPGRLEAVVFWVRTGDSFTDNGLAARLEIMREGLHGRTTDGVLVRASRLIDKPEDAPAAYASLEGFLHDLVAASPADVRTALVH